MQVGFVGLGKMGSRMVKRLLSKKFNVVCYDIDADARLKIAKQGAKTVSSLKDLTKELAQPRKIILMVPAGKAVDKVIAELHLSKGDMVIDAGNSYYEDSVRRAKMLEEKQICFIDAGTSGGLKGAEVGLSFTVGGERKAYEKLKPIFEALAAKDGLCYVGPSGSGHFVKMVHNAIEYAMLQAYAEGFELLSKAPYKVNLAEIAHAWNNGGLIRSWLLKLAEEVLKSDELHKIKGIVGGGETGTWAVDEATKRGVAFPIIKTALAERVKSKQTETFTGRFIAAMRNKFGGHRVMRAH